MWSSVDSYQRRRRDVDCGPLLIHIRGGGTCRLRSSVESYQRRRDVDRGPLLIHREYDKEEGGGT